MVLAHRWSLHVASHIWSQPSPGPEGPVGAYLKKSTIVSYISIFHQWNIKVPEYHEIFMLVFLQKDAGIGILQLKILLTVLVITRHNK